ADPAELSAFAQALAPWEDVGTGQTGPARATFRLAEIPAEPDGVPFGAGAGDEPRQPAAAASGERAGDEQGGAADRTPDGSWGGPAGPGTVRGGGRGRRGGHLVTVPGGGRGRPVRHSGSRPTGPPPAREPRATTGGMSLAGGLSSCCSPWPTPAC